jgi:SpoVK/Ycf46/Vps4 family AAA+-type ATPase
MDATCSKNRAVSCVTLARFMMKRRDFFSYSGADIAVVCRKALLSSVRRICSATHFKQVGCLTFYLQWFSLVVMATGAESETGWSSSTVATMFFWWSSSYTTYIRWDQIWRIVRTSCDTSEKFNSVVNREMKRLFFFSSRTCKWLLLLKNQL